MSKRTPKNHKNWQNTPIVLCWYENFLKAIRGNGYCFVPKDGTFPTENHNACCEKLWFVGNIYPNLPQIGQKITTPCWCRSMTACQDSWISHKLWIYQNLKTRYLNVFGRVTVAGCLTFIPISCMGPKHAPKDKVLIFQPIYMHRSMCM